MTKDRRLEKRLSGPGDLGSFRKKHVFRDRRIGFPTSLCELRRTGVSQKAWFYGMSKWLCFVKTGFPQVNYIQYILPAVGVTMGQLNSIPFISLPPSDSAKATKDKKKRNKAGLEIVNKM